jgi:prevent-host-death family protein
MTTKSLQEARQQLGQLVDAAARGEAVVITRRGRRVAELRAIAPAPRPRLPDLSAFRASVAGNGSLTQTLLAMRNEART